MSLFICACMSACMHAYMCVWGEGGGYVCVQCVYVYIEKKN